MIKGGIGGANTLTGLKFEERIDLKIKFASLKGYSVKGNDLFYKGELVAQMYRKHEIYKKFLTVHKSKEEILLSRKLLPDDSIFVISNNVLFIIEIKFQHGQGSVDEKLQTCDFKKKQYIKLVGDTGIKIEYIYILNDWFKKDSYKDVLDYVRSVGCHYFFEELPLKFLGLPEPKLS